MLLLNVILALALVGFFTWLVVTYIPMPEVISKVIIVLVAIVCILWVLQVIGFVGPTIPHFH